ncbi:flavin reductase [Plantactinospora sp. WMMB334]|uniref:flavin reductase n=1 Tax=Plantactinospora sp. WMMB334 TaxID=3404119 RepID=UPI003B93E50D
MTYLFFAGFRPHLPIRPLFLCRTCGGKWPCQPARLALLAMFQDDRQGLRLHLARKLLTALADQPCTDTATLTTRFLAWLPPPPP